MIVILLTILSFLVPGERLSPGARYGHELVFDEARDQLVLFGGFRNDGEPLGDTWTWSKRNGWRLVSESGPSRRKWPAMAYDSLRKRVILHGGRTGLRQEGSSRGDTWEWNGEKWNLLSGKGPTPRDHHRMVYDRVRDRMVLFGGWNGKELLDDTWEFDGKNWLEIKERGPSARAPTGLAFDEKRGEVVLFGGKDLKDYFGDTWIWDGRKWTQRMVNGPRARSFHGMTYDSDHGRILLFSGRFKDELFRDTWSWDGERWKVLSTNGPVKRGVYAMAYDRKLRLAFFHGSGRRKDGAWFLDSETWAWKGDMWKSSKQ